MLAANNKTPIRVSAALTRHLVDHAERLHAAWRHAQQEPGANLVFNLHASARWGGCRIVVQPLNALFGEPFLKSFAGHPILGERGGSGKRPFPCELTRTRSGGL